MIRYEDNMCGYGDNNVGDLNFLSKYFFEKKTSWAVLFVGISSRYAVLNWMDF